MVAVGKDSPATDLKSLVALVNKDAGKLNYSTVGLGSTQHLIAEDIVQRTGMKAQPVPYKTTGEVVSALIRGDAAFAVELYHAIRGQVDGGQLKLLATATPNRWGPIPNVPTVADTIPGYGILGWYGLAFPAGTPQPVIDKLRGALKTVLAQGYGPQAARGCRRGGQPVHAGRVQQGDRTPTSTASRTSPRRPVWRRNRRRRNAEHASPTRRRPC